MVLDVCVASKASVLFHWSISLFWYQYHAVLITVALQYSLKSGSVMPPALFFSLRIVLAIWALFWFYIKLKVVFIFGSVYVMNYIYTFACIEAGLHLRDESDLIIMGKVFDVLLDSVFQCFIKDFYIRIDPRWPTTNSSGL